MSSFNSVLKEKMSCLPRIIMAKILREKLESIGASNVDVLIEQIIDHMIQNAGNGAESINFDFDADCDISLELTKADFDRFEATLEGALDDLPNIIERTAADVSAQMLRSYERDWRAMRNIEDIREAEFCANLRNQWGDGFDLLRMLIDISREVGLDFVRRARRSKSIRRINLNSALYLLHARAILVASEAMVLIENGFADGAMARWRTLHEITCVAMILDDGGDALAKRYLDHDVVESKKIISKYEECSEELGYSKPSVRDIKKINCAYEFVIEKYGKGFGTDYGWVSEYLSISKPNFFDIEKAAGRAAMRSHYKMASHNIHAGTKGLTFRLGALDDHSGVIAGASNVGFVDPGHNLAINLMQITSLLLPAPWTIDKIAQLRALLDLTNRIGNALRRSQRSIERSERKLRRAALDRRSRRVRSKR